MPTGPEHLVLAACDELAGHGQEFVLGSDIIRKTGMWAWVVPDCLRGLEREGFVELARLENGDLNAWVTPKGRQELAKYSGTHGTSVSIPDQKGRIKVVPKGLRSFDEHDADFFWELLPGPFRAEGLPESIHFWKVRIEETDPQKTFQVGVIYGASGCGKSSLVKAGLLPRLNDHVRHVYIEATADRTESDLLMGVRTRYPDLPPGLGLTESLAFLKNQTPSLSGMGYLLVLDQFEQWILEHGGEEEPALVKALRHCDGQVGKALLMVRADFLAATYRLMKEVGVQYLSDRNACEVELFKPPHAEKVLTAFGRAEGLVGDNITTAQKGFVTRSIKALATDGGLIVPVRLAIFFQTVKNLEWNSKTLKKFGEAEDVGAAFLEKTFNDEYANRRYRDHQVAAQMLLGALLPDSGREIKRPSRARRDLLEVSGYSSQPERFDDLIRILDDELRLITAIDRDTIVVAESSTHSTVDRFYQLTHDFLVPSLREWRSNKDHEASQLVEAIWMAETKDVPRLVEQLMPLRFWANPILRRIMVSSGEASKERLHISLALFPVDHEQLEYLYSRLLVAGSGDLLVLRETLRPYRERLIPRLWKVMEHSDDESKYLQAGSALALYDQSDPLWVEIGSKIARAMITGNPVRLGFWLDALRPARDKLTTSLATIYQDSDHSETERRLAFNILEDFASDQPNVLATMLMASEEDHFAVLLNKLRAHRQAVVPLLEKEMIKWLPEAENERDLLIQRQARAAVAIAHLGRTETIWPLLRHSPTPSLRSYLVNWLMPLGADPKALLARMENLKSDLEKTTIDELKAMDSILFHPETSERRALILAMGRYDLDKLSPDMGGTVVGHLLEIYWSDPDAGIHGAAEWTLRRWRYKENVAAVDEELRETKVRANRRWFVNSEGQTYVTIEGPVEFMMGSPNSEPERLDGEKLHRMRINRRFAIASKAVTVDQFQRFVKTNPQFAVNPSYLDRFSPNTAGPIIAVTWYAAAAYCNWLSDQEGVPEEQWCYAPNSSGAYDEGMTIPADVLRRTGYRLPTEAEWEYACRSGTITSRYYGDSTNLLGKYAWFQTNSPEHAREVGSLLPNDLGLFDMLGNVFEWVQDRSGRPGQSDNFIDVEERVGLSDPRLLRGGSFDHLAPYVRSAFCNRNAPSYRISDTGFRPSRTIP